jgi:hypothetical protein
MVQNELLVLQGDVDAKQAGVANSMRRKKTICRLQLDNK